MVRFTDAAVSNWTLDAKSNEQPSVFAATCDVDDHFVCSGNFQQFTDDTGGGYTSANDKPLRIILISFETIQIILIGTLIRDALPRVS